MKKAEIFLQYQNLIHQPPISPKQMYAQACSNDEVTGDSWRTIWIRNATENKKTYGSFKDHGIGEIFGSHQNKPVIVVGSGPSLKGNAKELVNKGEIPIVSCLHNFHYLEDLGVNVDYYVSLDAGEITIEEVSEGGSKTPEEYWEITKDRTLLCFIGSPPALLKKWQGKILFFSCPMPSTVIHDEMKAVEDFNQYVSTGGNVLGACTYIAKAFLGASTVIFTGADFCFSYDHKFHAWDSKYDAHIGNCVHLTDVYGIKRLTWQSYANFKAWFDSKALTVPGYWINASEGGCLGSYPEGNLSCFKYMDLKDVFGMFGLNSHIKAQIENPDIKSNIILF